MELYRKRDLNKCGIYLIRNKINNKIYIGKSINIYERIRVHINRLNKNSLDENRYLIRSWNKYGRENFEYEVLEYCEKSEEILKQKELYWINYHNSTNRNTGFNLRIDTSTNCIVSEETRKLQSKNRKQRYKDKPELRKLLSINATNFWKNNPEIKRKMIDKLSEKMTRYKIEQYDKNMNYIRTWNKVKDIIKENPNYKVHNIYSVCSGAKPTIYGFIWRKVLINE